MSKENKENLEDPESSSEVSHECGVLCFRPKCLQPLNNMKVFMVCFTLLGLFHGMSNSYFSSVIPSIEKRFNLTSKMMGLILGINDVGHVLVALLVGHFGGRGHRPRWIALGSFILGVALMLFALPEIVSPRQSNEVLTATRLGKPKFREQFCHSEVVSISSSGSLRNSTLPEIPKPSESKGKSCNEFSADGIIAPLIFCLAQFMLGIGATTPWVLGLPFIDDNVRNKNSALYFGLSFSGRLIGPLLGFALGALCNSLYVDLTTPEFTTVDPRWISAWYLGFLITGLGMCIATLTMMCFPASVPESNKKKGDLTGNTNKAAMTEEPVTIKDLPKNLKKILTNAPLMARIVCKVLAALIISGYFNFLPKFLAAQYHLSPRTASIASGFSGVLAAAVGIIAGSIVIKKYRLQPRHVSLMLIVSAIAFAIAHFVAIFLDCEQVDLNPNWKESDEGIGRFSDFESSNVSSPLTICPQTCHCNRKDFAPVCDMSSRTSFFSPCHAGCRDSKFEKGLKSYSECNCIAEEHGILPVAHNETKKAHLISSGFCKSSCVNFYVYVTVMFLLKAVASFPLSGTIMLTFRLVQPELKSMANAVSALLMSAFGYFPAPILMGTLIDSTCILWKEKECGEKGSCLLYDTDQFRIRMHLAVALAKLVVIALEVYVYFKVRDLKFEDEDSEEKDGNKPADLELETRHQKPADEVQVNSS